MKRLLAFGLLLIFVGVGFFVYGGSLIGFDYSKTTSSKVLTYDSCNKIILTGDAANVNIKYHNQDYVEVAYNDKNNFTYQASVSDETLNISYLENGVFNFNFFWYYSSKMTIKIPDNFDLKIEVSSGNIDIEDLTINSLEVKFRSGNVEIEDVVVLNDFTASGGSGNVDLENVSASNTTVKLSSGNIKFEDLAISNNIKFECTSGKIKGNNISGATISLKCTSGNIDLEELTSDSIVAEALSGNIKIEINGKHSDYAIIAHTKSGNCHVSSKIDGFKYLEVKTTSGNINIKFK